MTWKARPDTAFIIVDIQNDFCPGGSLAVTGGDEIIPLINSLRTHFETVVVTQDYHPSGHSSFASSHQGAAPFDIMDMPYGDQVLWPDHCVQGTKGVNFCDDFVVEDGDLIIQKGINPEIDSYSAFFENDQKTPPRFANGKTLADTLRSRGIKTIVIAGLAGDYCVAYTAIGGLNEGFNVVIVQDTTRSIDAETERARHEEIKKLGGMIIQSVDLQGILSR